MPLPSTYVIPTYGRISALFGAPFYALWTAAGFMLFDNAVMIIFFVLLITENILSNSFSTH